MWSYLDCRDHVQNDAVKNGQRVELRNNHLRSVSRFVSLLMKGDAKVKFATLIHPFAQMMLIDLSIQTG